MNRIAVPIIIASLLMSCTAGEVMMKPGSTDIQVGNNPPGEDFTQIGPISAKHGGGCGLFGSQGDYEGAMNILRNMAHERGADYIQIINQKGEHMTGLCLDRAYVIDGFAYKKIIHN